MKNSATIESLKSMRFGAMAAELERQMQDPATYAHMGFEERLGLLVDAEWNSRQSNKLIRCIRDARFAEPGAAVEDIEYYEDRHLDRALDILSDMLFCSRFDQSDVETERGVILEEIGMYEDTPEDLVSERLSAAVYRGSPLARPILGTQATLSKMDGPWLADWHSRHYHGGNMVAALAGSFTQQQVDQLKDCLSRLKPGVAPVEKQPLSLR